MKILWVAVDRSTRVASHMFGDLALKVSEYVDTDFVVRNTNNLKFGQYFRNATHKKIKDKPLLNPDKINKTYDFVVVDGISAFVTEEWRKIKIPKAFIVEEMHHPIWQEIENGVKFKFDFLFHKYYNALYDKHPKIKNKFGNVIYLPHCVNHNVFKPSSFKMIDVLLTGVVHQKVYPIRFKANSHLSKKKYFTRIARPADKSPNIIKKNDDRWPIGKQYADLLSISKISITGGSKLHYPVMKFFEILSSGSLLVSDYFKELGTLGFEPGKNMVKIKCGSPEQLDKQMRDLLNDVDKRCEIANNGRKLILERHTVDIRAKQLIDSLEN